MSYQELRKCGFFWEVEDLKTTVHEVIALLLNS